MDMRIEKREAFYVSGYSVKANEATHERDLALLREKYESKLKSLTPLLYFVAWIAEDGEYTLLLGVQAQNQTPIAKGAPCIEVPAGCFAVGVVPEGTPIMTAWGDFFETGIPALGVAFDVEHGVYFGCFDETGGCELWTPVIKADI